MNMTTKKEICQEMLGAYIQASVEKKSKILDHICAVTSMHRKSVIRRLRKLQMKDPLRTDQRGRPCYYTPDVDAALVQIWEAANQLCGELLHGMIAEYVGIFIRDKTWKHTEEATGKLIAMSQRTIRRRCEYFEKRRGIFEGLSATKPSHLKSIIPIFKGPWTELAPGKGQLDTVAHCGNTLLGDMVYSLNFIDACTYWIVLSAQWNKGQVATLESMERIKKNLPFSWLMAHPDTGSEFINWLAKNWMDQNKIEFNRSEPGRKNDNMYVEERNGHVIRKYLGYTRIDNKVCVELINQLYEKLSDYLNHFMPVRRTLTKKRVGAKYVRTYERLALTPYQRVMNHQEVLQEIKDRLKQRHEKLNPAILKKEIDDMIQNIIKVNLQGKASTGLARTG